MISKFEADIINKYFPLLIQKQQSTKYLPTNLWQSESDWVLVWNNDKMIYEPFESVKQIKVLKRWVNVYKCIYGGNNTIVEVDDIFYLIDESYMSIQGRLLRMIKANGSIPDSYSEDADLPEIRTNITEQNLSTKVDIHN